MENIVLVRIDDRMLHGQVVSTWLKDYGIEQVLIINDKAANDPIQKSVAGLAAPKDVRVHLFGVEQFIDILKKTPIKRKTMLIFTTSTDVLKLVENGLEIKEVNVGGMRYNESRKRLSKAVSVTTEEEEAFKKLIKKDMKVFIQMIPKSDETMMKNLLK
ncbi:MAG: PTS sugar transporter subunit IIB [Sebaldella sp.]|nr:PTS sugar transporter subunit IIB [Sebaldella sp.]